VVYNLTLQVNWPSPSRSCCVARYAAYTAMGDTYVKPIVSGGEVQRVRVHLTGWPLTPEIIGAAIPAQLRQKASSALVLEAWSFLHVSRRRAVDRGMGDRQLPSDFQVLPLEGSWRSRAVSAAPREFSIGSRLRNEPKVDTP